VYAQILRAELPADDIGSQKKKWTFCGVRPLAYAIYLIKEHALARGARPYAYIWHKGFYDPLVSYIYLIEARPGAARTTVDTGDEQAVCPQ
jgi:hypothetical protein